MAVRYGWHAVTTTIGSTDCLISELEAERPQLSQRPREVHDLRADELPATDLTVPGGLIEALRRRLRDGRVEPQLAISEFASAVLEADQDQPSEPSALERRVDADLLELRDLVGHMAQSARRDQASVAYADEELTAVVQVRGRVAGIIPRAATKIRLRPDGRQSVKLAHGVGVLGLKASQLEHADHTGERISGVHGRRRAIPAGLLAGCTRRRRASGRQPIAALGLL